MTTAPTWLGRLPFDNAETYRGRGWTGVLGLPGRKKSPPPVGYTGNNGKTPTQQTLTEWRTHGYPTTRGGRIRPGNIAIRLPRRVIGIDVDNYGTKTGADTLTQLERELGHLPPTWVSSSRGDTHSGIRLYTLPAMPPVDAAWRDPGPDIELIHAAWRYVIVAPSVHPDTGETYRWTRPDGTPAEPGEIPQPGDLAEIPPEWFDYITGSTRDADGSPGRDPNATARAARRAADDEADAWLRDHTTGTPCARIGALTIDLNVAANREYGSAHDATRDAVLAVVRAAEQGHPGARIALARGKSTYIATVATDRGSDTIAAAEYDRLVRGAVTKVTDTPTVGGVGCTCPPPASTDPEPPDDPWAPASASPAPAAGDEDTTDPDEDFWDSRPVLTHIRDFARARRGSPWAVLGISLIRYAASIPPGVKLPPIIGSHASLNLFVALIAESSGGKGIANGIAVDAFDYPTDPPVFNLGSGEGITDRYVRRENHAKKGEKPDWVTVQHTQSVIFDVAEVDDLAALKSRQASTLLPQLRKAWSGEQLGFAYRDPDKALTVDRHAYRLGLIVGTQPRRAAAILDDDDGGTPQRFLWLPAADRHIPNDRPRQPERVKLWLPDGWDVRDPADVDHTMPVCAEAEHEIDRAAVERNRHGASELDGHTMLGQLKIAGVLAILEGRTGITSDDWHAARYIINRSTAQRDAVKAELRRAQDEANEARGRSEARRAVIVDDSREEAAVKRVAKRILDVLPPDGSWTSSSALRKKITTNDRGYFETALQRLVDAGQIDAEEVEYRGQVGTRYRLAGGDVRG